MIYKFGNNFSCFPKQIHEIDKRSNRAKFYLFNFMSNKGVKFAEKI